MVDSPRSGVFGAVGGEGVVLVVGADGVARGGVRPAVAQLADPVAADDADRRGDLVAGVGQVGVTETADFGRQRSVVGPGLEAVDA
jgi:hypothetical protein